MCRGVDKYSLLSSIFLYLHTQPHGCQNSDVTAVSEYVIVQQSIFSYHYVLAYAISEKSVRYPFVYERTRSHEDQIQVSFVQVNIQWHCNPNSRTAGTRAKENQSKMQGPCDVRAGRRCSFNANRDVSRTCKLTRFSHDAETSEVPTPSVLPLVSASLPSPLPQVPLPPYMECSTLATPPPGRGCLTVISLMLTWLNMAQNRLANVCCKLNKTSHTESFQSVSIK